jgi:hypothetical protein
MQCPCIAWEVRERRSQLAKTERTRTALTSHRRKSGDGPLLSRCAGETSKGTRFHYDHSAAAFMCFARSLAL